MGDDKRELQCHSKVTGESVPFRNTLGGFMTKVPQELGQGLCQPIFRSALGKRLLCRKWYHRLFFFFFFFQRCLS